ACSLTVCRSTCIDTLSLHDALPILVEHGLVDLRVGGDDDEHGRQTGGEHACAFGHPADRVPGGPGPAGGLRDGVGGHNGFRSVGSGITSSVGIGYERRVVAMFVVSEDMDNTVATTTATQRT